MKPDSIQSDSKAAKNIVRIVAKAMIGAALGASAVAGGAWAADAASEPQGLTRQEFNDTIRSIQDRYSRSGVFKANASSFYIDGHWQDGTKNTNASKRGTRWHINIYGGMGRMKGMTKDVLTMVICSEIGTLGGGFPMWTGHGEMTRVNAMSSGPNSIYYATYVCANHLWGHQASANAKARDVVDAESQQFCDAVFAKAPDQNLCYRKLNAVRSLFSIMGSSKDKPVSIETPDETIVDKTKHGANTQCRYDTWLAGAACTKYSAWDHAKYPMNEQEMAAQTCAAPEADYPYDSADVIKAGLRPFCWFKPGL